MACNNLLQRIAGTLWGADKLTIQTGALAIVYSAPEYAFGADCIVL